ncbi:MAG TPA: YceD family protein [Gammaproteobacteria bacterium]
MREVLPEFLDPLLLAGKEAVIAGRLAVDEMPRLRAQLVAGGVEVAVNLRLERQPGGLRTVCGEIVGEAELACQRCLQPLRWQIDCRVALAVVASRAEEQRLPEGYEPLYLDGGPLATRELVEDEILLGLPLVAMHPDPACNRELQEWQREGIERENPFGVLEQLKDKRQRN